MEKIKYGMIGIGTTITFFFVLGIPTAVIKNPWFTRMIETNLLDISFLVITSILLGTFLSISLYKKYSVKACTTSTYAGGFGSVFAFGCPICNKALVFLFGTSAIMTYFEPYRPVLGIVSILILLGSIFYISKKSTSKIGEGS